MLAPETASLSLRGDRPDGAYRDPVRPDQSRRNKKLTRDPLLTQQAL